VAYKAVPGSFQYRRAPITVAGLPYVIEAAFAWVPKGGRLNITGINFSPVIGGHPFAAYEDLFATQHVTADAPVMVFLHLTTPRLDFTDKGKSKVALDGTVLAAMLAALRKVTEPWRRQIEREYRDTQARLRREEALDREARKKQWSRKDAAFAVMERAYQKVSDGGRLPANAKQLHYAARPWIIQRVGEGTTITAPYFTQDVLPEYMRRFQPVWQPAYDARGHFTEPHTLRSSGLGTLEVADYIAKFQMPKAVAAILAKAKVETIGPLGRIAGVLFIEKEGFLPLMRAAKIAEKYDLLICSTKGFSVVAVRHLVDVLCGQYGLPLYRLRDFDIAGFGIAKTLSTSGDRYTFKHLKPKTARIIDLGLRLADIDGLEREAVALGKNRFVLAKQLRKNDATEAEIEYLLGGPVYATGIEVGYRVELNAMTSVQFIDFVERKLRDVGAKKVVPDEKMLQAVYAAFVREKMAAPKVEAVLKRIASQPVSVPADLVMLLDERIGKHPAEAWDEAVRKIVTGEEDE
jgi:hypothetical protein